jgi:AraC-like DNA-binding protein
MLRSQPSTVPAAWVAHLASVVARYKVSSERLLEGQPLAPQDLVDPNARVSLATLIAIIERARFLSREPALGVELGLHTRATLWGNLGFATLSAPSMRAAIELAIRFCDLVTPAIALRLREDGAEAELILDERDDFGSARDVIVLWLLLGIWNVGRMMTGAPSTARLELAFAEPAYASRLPSELPAVRFGQPASRLLFDAWRLDLPYVLHDPSALRTAVELCERQHEALGHGDAIAPRVRQLLTRSIRALPSFKAMAGELHLSPRTLSRRLAAEGTSFQALMEEERKRQGVTLVAAQERTISEIADRLGYSNASNFERAFRRWTGRSPTQYRRAR